MSFAVLRDSDGPNGASPFVCVSLSLLSHLYLLSSARLSHGHDNQTVRHIRIPQGRAPRHPSCQLPTRDFSFISRHPVRRIHVTSSTSPRRSPPTCRINNSLPRASDQSRVPNSILTSLPGPGQQDASSLVHRSAFAQPPHWSRKPPGNGRRWTRDVPRLNVCWLVPSLKDY